MLICRPRSPSCRIIVSSLNIYCLDCLSCYITTGVEIYHVMWYTQFMENPMTVKVPNVSPKPKDESCPGTCDNTNKWSPFGNNVNQLPLEFFNFGIISVMNEEKIWWRIYGQVSQAAYATHLPWSAPCRPPWFCPPLAPGPLKTRSLQPGSQHNKTITSREWVCSLSEK